MNTPKLMLRSILIIAATCCCMLPFFRVGATDSTTPVPSLIENGFGLWAKKGPSYAFDAWKTGGLLENDNKPGTLSTYFARMDRTLGNFKSYDVIETKRINSTSQIVYLSVNFDRAAVYGRFLLYRAGKGWVVQNMDFSPKPEAIMPWLAFAGGNYEGEQ